MSGTQPLSPKGGREAREDFDLCFRFTDIALVNEFTKRQEFILQSLMQPEFVAEYK
jgi:hypothetical protein